MCHEEVVNAAMRAAVAQAGSTQSSERGERYSSEETGWSIGCSKFLTSILYTRLAVALGRERGVPSLEWLDYLQDARISPEADVLKDIGNPVALA
jgi:hypothetical protein